MTASASSPEWVVGRYQVFDEIATGGMATVYYGRLLGPVGFSRVVAIKRLHPHLAKDPEFVAMFIDEARLAAKVHHPNVVPMLDVVATDDHLVLVMEYVQGETLARLIRKARTRGERIFTPVAASIVVGALYGLHAAHEAKGDKGEPLGLVHRDVSPQNIVVGTDGIARVLDFGIAKAAGRLQTTREGRLKGKLAYMAPEHIRGERVTRAADIYAAAVVLWEALVGERLFSADNDAELLEQVLAGKIASTMGLGAGKGNDEGLATVPTALHEVVLRGLALNPKDRYATAHEMARDIERRTRVASAGEVSEWLERMAGEGLAEQARKLAEIAAPPPPAPAPTDVAPTQTPALATAATPPVSSMEPRRKSIGMLLPLVTLAMIGIAGLGVLVWKHRQARIKASAVDSIASAPTSSSSAEPDDTQVLGVESTSESPSGIGARPRSKFRRSSPASRPGAKPCVPPYVIDDQGVKHYKVECL